MSTAPPAVSLPSSVISGRSSDERSISHRSSSIVHRPFPRRLRSAVCGQQAVILLFFILSPAVYAQTSRLSVVIHDAVTNQRTPVRVKLVSSSGQAAPLPEAAIGIMYGHWDHADGYAYQPDSSFYCAGSFEVNLEPGTYTLFLSKGNEYLRQQHSLDLEAGQNLERTYRMERWIDMPSQGWYSADDHIHVRRSPREDPLLMQWIQAEDVHVGVMLRMGDFWATYYQQYAWGEAGAYQQGHYLLTSGQEDPRTPELGHTLGMGASDRVRFQNEYYYYDKVFDRIHELGGVAGYAHQAETFHGHRGLTLDGLRGKVDIIELLQFCADEGPLITEHYYRMLDLGFDVTAVAGSDFPWCGQDHRYGIDVPREKAAQIGNVRFYTYLGDSLTYASWKAGLDAGHTFVSSGPILFLTVNDHLPGDHLEVSSGSPLKITVHAYGQPEQVPLSTLEIIGHGEVIRTITPGEDGQSSAHLGLEFEIPASQGIWIAARAFAGPMQVAHTTPVYVHVDGRGFHNPQTVAHYLDLSEQYLRELEDVIATPSTNIEHQAWRYREGLHERINETRGVIETLRNRLE